MKYSFLILFIILFSFLPISAQVDSAVGQISNSGFLTFAGGISGEGRFVVMESAGNIATENPRNADGNREVFLFDYAQRRIFQITDTKSLLTDPAGGTAANNVKVEILNVRPVISNDGRWIAFGSNATTSVSTGSVNGTNPGSFDANSFNVTTGTTTTNPLTSDGNTEVWLYQIPAAPPVDLKTGAEIPFVALTGGSFIQVTNTPASRLPFFNTTTGFPIIADDNRSVSVNDDASVIAFVSNRNLVPCATTPSATCGNAYPDFDNDEIFTYVRTPGTLNQVTATPRGSIGAPIINLNPTISGAGTRVAFQSNANNPVVGMTGGSNADLNEEVYYTDLAAGIPTAASARQITQTTRANPGDVVNIFNYGRRMSRDGRYIAFDSAAELSATGTGVGTNAFALYLFDTMNSSLSQIGPRSNADTAVPSPGEVPHYPVFTQGTDATGNPVSVLVFTTRQNISPTGIIPANAADGLNPDATRPPQFYSAEIPAAGQPAAVFTRLTKFPALTFSQFGQLTPQQIQALPSNRINRMSFTYSLNEIGTGNFDPFFPLNEAFYYLLPERTAVTEGTLSYATGASRLTVTVDPVPTPSPTATPTGSPTPTTPTAVQGTSPGSLAIVNFTSAITQPAVVPRTAVGSLDRRFPLPIELSGVTMTIDGVGVGLKSVTSTEIVFVVPRGIAGTNEKHPVVINNNGVIIRGEITISAARPDIFNFSNTASPNGRARIFNITNRVFTTEPFTVTTVRFRGGTRVPTVLRLFLTGVQGVPASLITIKIGDVEIPRSNILNSPVEVEPGIYTIDFRLPPELNMAGDVPIVISINGGANLMFSSRLADTAPRLRIL